MRIFGNKSEKIAKELLSLEADVSALSPTQLYVTDKETNTGKLGDVIPVTCGTIKLSVKNLKQDKPRIAYNLLKALEQEIQRNVMQTEALALISAVPRDPQRINKLKEFMTKLGKISNKIKRDLLYSP